MYIYLSQILLTILTSINYEKNINKLSINLSLKTIIINIFMRQCFYYKQFIFSMIFRLYFSCQLIFFSSIGFIFFIQTFFKQNTIKNEI